MLPGSEKSLFVMLLGMNESKMVDAISRMRGLCPGYSSLKCSVTAPHPKQPAPPQGCLETTPDQQSQRRGERLVFWSDPRKQSKYLPSKMCRDFTRRQGPPEAPLGQEKDQWAAFGKKQFLTPGGTF